MDGTQRTFGRKGSGASVVVPWEFTTHEARCAIAVDTTSSMDEGDWYKIWAAAIAVEVMCVETSSRPGYALGLGE